MHDLASPLTADRIAWPARQADMRVATESLAQRLRRLGGLLAARRVLPRDRIHPADRRIVLPNVPALPSAGRDDLVETERAARRPGQRAIDPDVSAQRAIANAAPTGSTGESRSGAASTRKRPTTPGSNSMQ
ncbi:hypothetical protein BGC_31920 [Burkholderia sp. 3C]